MDPLYLWALGFGLMGGFSHCIGMCGIFVVSYAGLPDPKAKSRFVHPERHLLFHGGRLISLMLLGFIGGVLGQLTHTWSHVQGIVSLVAGLVLLGLALGFAGIFPKLRIPEPDVLGAGGGRGRRLFVRVLKSQGALKPALLGIFVGLLPCGITYQSLILGALTQNALKGMLTMLCFGLGTVPGLLTLGLFGNALFGGALMKPKFRNAMTKFAALLMGIMAISFIYRGVQGL